MTDILPQIVLVIFLIALNAFFAASEYAIVAVRKSRIDELVKKGDFVARLIQRALDNREQYISTIQIGTTIVSLILGWLGEPVIAKLLMSPLFFLPSAFRAVIVQTIAVILSLLILTFISIVLGELIPKTIALYNAEYVSFIVIAPLAVLAKLFSPLVRALTIVNTVILKFFGFTTTNTSPLTYSREEIKIMLEQIHTSGDLKEDGFEMMQNVFTLSDKPIKQIMTPRTEIVAVDISSSISTIMKKIDGSYSRFPVYSRSLDNIVGFVHVKDIYKLAINMHADKKLSQTNLVRKLIFVPESKKADEVLLDMRKKHVHLAAAYNEFGVMAGIVTLEDIIESLVGDIQDEFDKPVKGITRNSDGSYRIDGALPVEKIQRRFRLPLKGQGYTTIAGVIFGLLGREPRIGDEIQIGHLFFEITSINGKRITQLLLKRESKKNNHSTS